MDQWVSTQPNERHIGAEAKSSTH